MDKSEKIILPFFDHKLKDPGLDISVTALLLGTLTLFALLTRLTGVGNRPLALDEYYFVRSVQNIMESGVPGFPSGGYYIRGIFPQYLTAVSIFLFGDVHFAYRLPAALFGCGTLLAAYFLGRQFFNRRWSILLVTMLTFSSWQIELSRFVRMYAFFQFTAVCFLWSFYKFSFVAKSSKRYIAVIFATFGILTSEFGIFLALYLFLPIPTWSNQNLRRIAIEQRLYIIISSLVLGCGYVWIKYPIRSWGVTNALPDNFEAYIDRSAIWWSFGTTLFGEYGFFSIVALISAGLVVYYVFSIIRSEQRSDLEERCLGGLAVLAACCAVFHQFAMSGVALAIVFLRKSSVLFKKPYSYYLLLTVVFIIFWCVALFLNRAWIETVGLGNVARMYLRSFRLAFLGFPDFYTPVVAAWAESIPVLGCLIGISVAWQIVFCRRTELALLCRNPVMPVMIFIIIAGFRPPLYIQTRYSHFLYPLALCVGFMSAIQLTEALKRRFNWKTRLADFTGIGLCLVAFGLSEDLSISYLSNLSADSVAFRVGDYQRFEKHWYPRWDFQRAADFVNAEAGSNSKVIVSHTVHTVNAYLKKEFAVFWPREDIRFRLISRERGKRELWSNSRLLSTVEDVIEYTQHTESVWLFVYSGNDALKIDPEKTWPGRVRDVVVNKPGRDKRIEVWRIDLKPADGPV